MLFINILQTVGKLLYYKRNKTLQDALALENNHLWGGISNSTLHWIASYQPIVDYFPITACVIML